MLSIDFSFAICFRVLHHTLWVIWLAAFLGIVKHKLVIYIRSCTYVIPQTKIDS